MQSNCLIVVALALFDQKGQVLLAQRPLHKSLGGLWELPGGKLEAGESPEGALVREIDEELGLTLDPASLIPLGFASHAYEKFHLLMPVFWSMHDGAAPKMAEGQMALDWVDPNLLAHDGPSKWPMPPADLPLIDLLIGQSATIKAQKGICA